MTQVQHFIGIGESFVISFFILLLTLCLMQLIGVAKLISIKANRVDHLWPFPGTLSHYF